jgi:hypothetical protein
VFGKVGQLERAVAKRRTLSPLFPNRRILASSIKLLELYKYFSLLPFPFFSSPDFFFFFFFFLFFFGGGGGLSISIEVQRLILKVRSSPPLAYGSRNQ